jgi:hypothetical protein
MKNSDLKPAFPFLLEGLCHSKLYILGFNNGYACF